MRRRNRNYNAQNIMKRLIEAVSECYESTGELKRTADEFSMSALKIRKLLVTAGLYSNDISDEICKLYSEGKTIAEIQEITGLGKSSVNGYLPYTKVVYKPEELSLNADRIIIYRERQRVVDKLCIELDETVLFDAIVLFQNYPFYTLSGLPFEYRIKKCQDGLIDSVIEIKSNKFRMDLPWSVFMSAFDKALELRGEIIDNPGSLGDTKDVTYIFPIFYRLGLIEVPDQVAEKMQLKGGKYKRKTDGNEQ